MANANGSVPAELALVEVAEAEAAEAEAKAAAAAARARAVRLRHGLEQPSDAGVPECPTDDSTVDRSDIAHLESAVADGRSGLSIRFRRPRGGTVMLAAAVLGLVVVLAANGFLAWHHYGANRDEQRAAEFIAAARQGVVNMTTLDFNNAEADVSRVLDSSSGEFREDFASRVDAFTEAVRNSKVVTAGTVTAAAVESMDRDSAVVLVAATSTLTNEAGDTDEPRHWRLSVTVSRDKGQLTMSKVEFVP